MVIRNKLKKSLFYIERGIDFEKKRKRVREMKRRNEKDEKRNGREKRYEG